MLSKKYLKSRQLYKITFDLPVSELPEEELADGRIPQSVSLVGDFNDWDSKITPMKYIKKHDCYRATVALEPEQNYQFRYLVNGRTWCNDWQADGYVPNNQGSDNYLVTVPAKPSA